MANEKNKLTFVRCPSCNSLVPALSTRCRMCGATIEESNNQEPQEIKAPESRVRQKTMTIPEETKQQIMNDFGAGSSNNENDEDFVSNPFLEEGEEADFENFENNTQNEIDVDEIDPLSGVLQEETVNDDIFSDDSKEIEETVEEEKIEDVENLKDDFSSISDDEDIFYQNENAIPTSDDTIAEDKENYEMDDNESENVNIEDNDDLFSSEGLEDEPVEGEAISEEEAFQDDIFMNEGDDKSDAVLNEEDPLSDFSNEKENDIEEKEAFSYENEDIALPIDTNTKEEINHKEDTKEDDDLDFLSEIDDDIFSENIDVDEGIDSVLADVNKDDDIMEEEIFPEDSEESILNPLPEKKISLSKTSKGVNTNLNKAPLKFKEKKEDVKKEEKNIKEEIKPNNKPQIKENNTKENIAKENKKPLLKEANNKKVSLNLKPKNEVTKQNEIKNDKKENKIKEEKKGTVVSNNKAKEVKVQNNASTKNNEAKSVAKSEDKNEKKVEKKIEVKTEKKQEIKVDNNLKVKPKVKPEVKSEAKIEPKVEQKVEVKKETNPEVKVEEKKINKTNLEIKGRLVGWLVSFSDGLGKAFELRDGKFFVSKSNLKPTDFIIDDDSISTPHAMISINLAGDITVQDLMSEAGIFVKKNANDEYQKQETVFKLQHGDYVKFGNVEFIVSKIAHLGE